MLKTRSSSKKIGIETTPLYPYSNDQKSKFLFFSKKSENAKKKISNFMSSLADQREENEITGFTRHIRALDFEEIEKEENRKKMKNDKKRLNRNFSVKTLPTHKNKEIRYKAVGNEWTDS